MLAISPPSFGSGPIERDGSHGTDFLNQDPLIYLEVSRPEGVPDLLMSDRVQAFLKTNPDYEAALQSPQFQEARQAIQFVAGQLGTTWEEGLRSLIGGGIVIGLEEADPPRLVVVVTPSDAEFLERAHTLLVSLAREDADKNDKPDPITEFEYRGVRCFSLSEEEAHAILDGRLVLSNGRSGLETVIDRHLDGGDRLTDAPEFQESRPDDDPMAWAFARVDRLRELDPDRFSGIGDEPNEGVMFLLGAWIELIQQTPFASATLDWTEDRLAASLTLKVPPDGRSELMARFLPPEGAGAPSPIKVEGSLATINLWRDQEALWQVREEILPPEALQNLAQLDSLAGAFFGGQEFGDAVLAPLGDHLQLVVAHQDYEAMDPAPELLLPAFALVVDLDPDRPDFAQQLRIAFQSFLGLINLGAADSGGPTLILGSETHDGVAISLATFAPAPPADDNGQEEPDEVHYRHNYSPSVAEVDGRFVISSSVGLTRSLIDALKANPEPETIDATLLMTADGDALAEAVDRNRERLILQNMLKQGNDRETAEQEISIFSALLRFLGQGSLLLEDDAEQSTLSVEFFLGDLD